MKIILDATDSLSLYIGDKEVQKLVLNLSKIIYIVFDDEALEIQFKLDDYMFTAKFKNTEDDKMIYNSFKNDINKFIKE